MKRRAASQVSKLTLLQARHTYSEWEVQSRVKEWQSGSGNVCENYKITILLVFVTMASSVTAHRLADLYFYVAGRATPTLVTSPMSAGASKPRIPRTLFQT